MPDNPLDFPFSARMVIHKWARDPEGTPLHNLPDTPVGMRTPNNLIWAHSNDHFFIFPTNSRYNPYRTGPNVWSRSMVQEFGENYMQVEHQPEPCPRRLRPWPILTLPPGVDCEYALDVPDDTCAVGRGDLEGPLTSGKGVDPSVDQVINEVQSDINGMDVDDPPIPQDNLTPCDTKPANTNSEIDPSFQSTPKLEEYIPKQFFPDILLVNDPDCITEGGKTDVTKMQSVEPIPRKYRRVWPKFTRDDDPTPSSNADASPTSVATPRVALLNLSSAPLIGSGNHSIVHRASLKLPPPLTARSPTNEVTVAAKMALPDSDARNHLYHEARIYYKFPEHLMEEWSGFNYYPERRGLVPVTAVVPKFFGFYIPVEETTNEDEEKIEMENGHEPAGKEKGKEKKKLSPILLLEECGSAINPAAFTVDERDECYSLVLRLHEAGFIQGSLYSRNILAQPGPLTNPPSLRSMKTPSFRIIDFGRAVYKKRFLEKEFARKQSHITDEASKKEVEDRSEYKWNKMVANEIVMAKEEIDGDVEETRLTFGHWGGGVFEPPMPYIERWNKYRRWDGTPYK